MSESIRLSCPSCKAEIAGRLGQILACPSCAVEVRFGAVLQTRKNVTPAPAERPPESRAPPVRSNAAGISASGTPAPSTSRDPRRPDGEGAAHDPAQTGRGEITGTRRVRLLGRRVGSQVTMFSAFGLSLVLFAIALLLIQSYVPWLTTDDGAQTKAELIADGFVTDDHLRGFFTWPLMGALSCLGIGVLLVLNDLVPNHAGVRRLIQLGLTAAAAVAGFMIGLGGMRMLGWFIDQSLDPGQATASLHAAPYIHMDVGLFLCLWALLLMWEALRTFRHYSDTVLRRGTALPFVTLVVAMGALVVLALFPFATQGDPLAGDRTFIGAHDMALAAFEGDAALGPAAEHLAFVEAMAWVLIWASLVVVVLLALAATDFYGLVWGGAAQLYHLSMVPAVMGLVFAIAMHMRIAQAPGTGLSFNVAAPLAFVVLTITQLRYFQTVSIPYLRQVFTRSQALEGAGALQDDARDA